MLGGGDGVSKQQRNGQRTDTAGDGRECAGHLGNGRVDVADDHRSALVEVATARRALGKERFHVRSGR